MWQQAFLAMGAALGEPLDDVLACLGDDHASRVVQLVTALRAESRQTRARAMAQHLAAVAADVDAMELSW